jgi:metal-responsive CopG/Arc/MetJ family transcriptional regulator
MNDTARGERLQIMLTQEELEALDNWRFDRRMPSRAAAVRELLKRGLADVSASAEKRGRSQDFGVIGSAEEQSAADGHATGMLDGDGRDRGDGADGHG